MTSGPGSWQDASERAKPRPRAQRDTRELMRAVLERGAAAGKPRQLVREHGDDVVRMEADGTDAQGRCAERLQAFDVSRREAGVVADEVGGVFANARAADVGGV